MSLAENAAPSGPAPAPTRASSSIAAPEVDDWVAEPWLPQLRTTRGAIGALISALVLVALTAAAGEWAGPITAAVQLATAAVFGVLVVTDLTTQRLPDVIVLPLLGVVTALEIVAGLVGEQSTETVWWSLGCGAGAFVVFYAIAFFSGQMGFGDVKLAALIGVVLGGVSPAVAAAGLLLVPALASIPAIIALLVAKSLGSKVTGMPFGPFLIAGYAGALLLVDEIIAYVDGLSFLF